MRVTSKGQVTIPQHIREKYGIHPHSEVEFEEKDGEVTLKAVVNRNAPDFSSLIGIASVKMSTDEILALTRSDH